MFLLVQKTPTVGARKGNLQRAFPLHVLMVPSSAITIATDGERLTCGGFSLDEAVRLGNFEFITDYIGSLSLFPRRGDSGATFMGSTRSRTPSPRRAMIEDSADEFLTTSSREGGFAPLSQKVWHGRSTLSCHNHTMVWRTLRPLRPR
jgi:hypothetical protein